MKEKYTFVEDGNSYKHFDMNKDTFGVKPINELTLSIAYILANLVPSPPKNVYKYIDNQPIFHEEEFCNKLTNYLLDKVAQDPKTTYFGFIKSLQPLFDAHNIAVSIEQQAYFQQIMGMYGFLREGEPGINNEYLLYLSEMCNNFDT